MNKPLMFKITSVDGTAHYFNWDELYLVKIIKYITAGGQADGQYAEIEFSSLFARIDITDEEFERIDKELTGVLLGHPASSSEHPCE